jgi:hypothetical protein
VRGASAVDEQAWRPELGCGYGGAAEWLGPVWAEGGASLIGDGCDGERARPRG